MDGPWLRYPTRWWNGSDESRLAANPI